MENVLNHAEAVLRQHPAPAMELAELHLRTSERFPTGMPSCADLRQLMESHPDRFRVLDPWEGVLMNEAWEDEVCPGADVLVVPLRPQPEALTRTPEARLRESIRWMAGVKDIRSRRCVARVYGLLREGSAAHAHLVRKAA